MKAYLALLVTSTVWGTTWVASKKVVASVPALQMAAIRQLIAGMALISFFLLYKKIPFPTAKEFRWLLMMALLMFVLANGLSTWGVKYIPAGLGALIGTLYPLCVVLIEAIFFGKKNISPLTLIGLVLGIGGVGIVFYENAFHSNGEHYVFGLILSLAAMASWSLGTIFLGRNKMNMNPYYATGWQMFLSSIMLYILASVTAQKVPIGQISVQSWLIIFYLVLFGSIIAFAAFIYSMKKLPVAVASLYAYINPLVALAIGAVLLGDTITNYIVWGALVTLSGVFLVNYSVRRSRRLQVMTEPEQ